MKTIVFCFFVCACCRALSIKEVALLQWCKFICLTRMDSCVSVMVFDMLSRLGSRGGVCVTLCASIVIMIALQRLLSCHLLQLTPYFQCRFYPLHFFLGVHFPSMHRHLWCFLALRQHLFAVWFGFLCTL